MSAAEFQAWKKQQRKERKERKACPPLHPPAMTLPSYSRASTSTCHVRETCPVGNAYWVPCSPLEILVVLVLSLWAGEEAGQATLRSCSRRRRVWLSGPRRALCDAAQSLGRRDKLGPVCV